MKLTVVLVLNIIWLTEIRAEENKLDADTTTVVSTLDQPTELPISLGNETVHKLYDAIKKEVPDLDNAGRSYYSFKVVKKETTARRGRIASRRSSRKGRRKESKRRASKSSNASKNEKSNTAEKSKKEVKSKNATVNEDRLGANEIYNITIFKLVDSASNGTQVKVGEKSANDSNIIKVQKKSSVEVGKEKTLQQTPKESNKTEVHTLINSEENVNNSVIGLTVNSHSTSSINNAVTVKAPVENTAETINPLIDSLLQDQENNKTEVHNVIDSEENVNSSVMGLTVLSHSTSSIKNAVTVKGQSQSTTEAANPLILSLLQDQRENTSYTNTNTGLDLEVKEHNISVLGNRVSTSAVNDSAKGVLLQPKSVPISDNYAVTNTPLLKSTVSPGTSDSDEEDDDEPKPSQAELRNKKIANEEAILKSNIDNLVLKGLLHIVINLVSHCSQNLEAGNSAQQKQVSEMKSLIWEYDQLNQLSQSLGDRANHYNVQLPTKNAKSNSSSPLHSTDTQNSNSESDETDYISNYIVSQKHGMDYGTKHKNVTNSIKNLSQKLAEVNNSPTKEGSANKQLQREQLQDLGTIFDRLNKLVEEREALHIVPRGDKIFSSNYNRKQDSLQTAHVLVPLKVLEELVNRSYRNDCNDNKPSAPEPFPVELVHPSLKNKDEELYDIYEDQDPQNYYKPTAPFPKEQQPESLDNTYQDRYKAYEYQDHQTYYQPPVPFPKEQQPQSLDNTNEDHYKIYEYQDPQNHYKPPVPITKEQQPQSLDHTNDDHYKIYEYQDPQNHYKPPVPITKEQQPQSLDNTNEYHYKIYEYQDPQNHYKPPVPITKEEQPQSLDNTNEYHYKIYEYQDPQNHYKPPVPFPKERQPQSLDNTNEYHYKIYEYQDPQNHYKPPVPITKEQQTQSLDNTNEYHYKIYEYQDPQNHYKPPVPFPKERQPQPLDNTYQYRYPKTDNKPPAPIPKRQQPQSLDNTYPDYYKIYEHQDPQNYYKPPAPYAYFLVEQQPQSLDNTYQDFYRIYEPISEEQPENLENKNQELNPITYNPDLLADNDHVPQIPTHDYDEVAENQPVHDQNHETEYHETEYHEVHVNSQAGGIPNNYEVFIQYAKPNPSQDYDYTPDDYLAHEQEHDYIPEKPAQTNVDYLNPNSEPQYTPIIYYHDTRDKVNPNNTNPRRRTENLKAKKQQKLTEPKPKNDQDKEPEVVHVSPYQQVPESLRINSDPKIYYIHSRASSLGERSEESDESQPTIQHERREPESKAISSPAVQYSSQLDRPSVHDYKQEPSHLSGRRIDFEDNVYLQSVSLRQGIIETEGRKKRSVSHKLVEESKPVKALKENEVTPSHSLNPSQDSDISRMDIPELQNRRFLIHNVAAYLQLLKEPLKKDILPFTGYNVRKTRKQRRKLRKAIAMQHYKKLLDAITL